jgi:hypothetical protein
MRFKPTCMLVALQREGVALVVDVVVGCVALANRAVVVSEFRFELVQSCEEWPDVQAGSKVSTLMSRTAPDLKRGCFDTGSQIVIVSSFAARWWAFDSSSSVSSQ